MQCAYRIPMTPHATLEPACPVVRLSVNPPRPMSSVSACTTTARPRMLWAPTSEMRESEKENCATPVLSAWMLPKSPACLVSSLGPPCLFCEKKNDKYVSITYQFNGVVVFIISYKCYHSRVQMILQ